MISSSHVLLASAFYQRQEDGNRKRFTQGDVITGLSADDVKRLTKAGAIAPADAAQVKTESAPADRPEVPKQVAPKAEWVEYAVNGAPPKKRLSREDAEDLTKADLIEMFGE